MLSASSSQSIKFIYATAILKWFGIYDRMWSLLIGSHSIYFVHNQSAHSLELNGAHWGSKQLQVVVIWAHIISRSAYTICLRTAYCV